jgi:tRNA-splicing ligase RtcB
MQLISGKIVIWRDHEPKTITQIERCTKDERVVRATLCADGHLGYAVPIGAVAAYMHMLTPWE